MSASLPPDDRQDHADAQPPIQPGGTLPPVPDEDSDNEAPRSARKPAVGEVPTVETVLATGKRSPREILRRAFRGDSRLWDVKWVTAATVSGFVPAGWIVRSQVEDWRAAKRQGATPLEMAEYTVRIAMSGRAPLPPRREFDRMLGRVKTERLMDTYAEKKALARVLYAADKPAVVYWPNSVGVRTANGEVHTALMSPDFKDFLQRNVEIYRRSGYARLWRSNRAQLDPADEQVAEDARIISKLLGSYAWGARQSMDSQFRDPRKSDSERSWLCRRMPQTCRVASDTVHELRNGTSLIYDIAWQAGVVKTGVVALAFWNRDLLSKWGNAAQRRWEKKELGKLGLDSLNIITAGKSDFRDRGLLREFKSNTRGEHQKALVLEMTMLKEHLADLPHGKPAIMIWPHFVGARDSNDKVHVVLMDPNTRDRVDRSLRNRIKYVHEHPDRFIAFVRQHQDIRFMNAQTVMETWPPEVFGVNMQEVRDRMKDRVAAFRAEREEQEVAVATPDEVAVRSEMARQPLAAADILDEKEVVPVSPRHAERRFVDFSRALPQNRLPRDNRPGPK